MSLLIAISALGVGTPTVRADASTLTLTSDPNPSLSSKPATFTAVIDPIPAAGWFRFQVFNAQNSTWATYAEMDFDGSGSAQWVTSMLPYDAPTQVRAVYLDGNGVQQLTSNTVTQTVNLLASAVSMTFDAPSYPYRVAPMALLHFTAIDQASWVQVSIERPNGSVLEQSARVATIAGQTDVSVRIPIPGDDPQPPALLSPGTWTARARFNGGGAWDYSYSDPVPLVVTSNATATAISTPLSVTGSTEDFSVSVVVTTQPPGFEGGSVSLKMDGIVVGNATVTPAGLASITVVAATLESKGITLLGHHDLIGLFTGTIGRDPSTSAVLGHDISDTVSAYDTFGRTVTNGWGSSTFGGPYVIQGTAADYRVGSGVGRITAAAGANRSAILNGVVQRDVDLSFRVALDALPIGGQVYVYGVLRHVATSSEYRAKVRVAPNGAVYLTPTSVVNGTETALATEQRVTGLTAAAAAFIWVRAQVSGVSPATIRIRAWADGTAEPSGWNVTGTNSAALLQTAGTVGVRAYPGSGITNPPTAVSFDDLRVQSPGGADTAPVVDSASVSPASPTTNQTLTASYAAHDAEGDPLTALYMWWLNGTQIAGASGPTLDLSVPGNGDAGDTITLWVRVNDGTLNSAWVSATPVTVAGVQAPTTYASDAFARTVSNGWGTAATGGAYTLQGTAADYSVNGSTGRISVAAGATRSALLPVQQRDVELSFRVSLAALPVGGQQYVYGVVRHVSSNSEYRVKIRVAPNGAVYLQGTALVGGTETGIGTEVKVAGLTAAPGAFIWVRAQAAGTSGTTLRIRAWLDGTTEPSTWQYTATDGSSALQIAGTFGVRAYTASAVTSGPVVISFDDLRVTSIPS